MKERPVVLITGASRGIGRSIACAFAREGYDLILICQKRIDLLNDLCLEFRRYGVSCSAYICDVKNYDDVRNIYHQCKNEIGVPDIIINNAGIAHIGLLIDMTPDQWHNVIDTNLTGIFNICRIFTPDMIKNQYGRIINISSVWGNIGASCEAAYSASKGGVNSFTKALAKELAPSHISVNAIACGAIDTEMNRWLSDEDRQALIDEIPACRMGTPQEIGEMSVLLAKSPDYLTGQVITIDGGWT